MRFKLILLAILLIGFLSKAQNITSKELMGEWTVVKVHIPNKSPKNEAVKFIKDAFKRAKFTFNGNTIFTIKYGKKADERIKELFFLDGENWIIENNQILVGTKNNGFSTVQMTVEKTKRKTYFVLPMMRLEMKKISDDQPSEPQISKNKTDYQVYKSQVEHVEVVTRVIDENDIIPFAVIENPPLAPDCKEKWDTDKKRKCTRKFIQMHVARKFNTELASQEGVVGKIKIMIEFVIDTEGNPVNIKASGGSEIVNQNAIDVISVLPNLKPGVIDGKPINVSYQMPLLFQVEE